MMVTIKEGATGEAAQQATQILQNILGIPATGTFDAATTAAVKKFQASKGLPADGVVGPATWTALGAGTGGAAPSAKKPAPAKAPAAPLTPAPAPGKLATLKAKLPSASSNTIPLVLAFALIALGGGMALHRYVK